MKRLSILIAVVAALGVSACADSYGPRYGYNGYDGYYGQSYGTGYYDGGYDHRDRDRERHRDHRDRDDDGN